MSRTVRLALEVAVVAGLVIASTIVAARTVEGVDGADPATPGPEHPSPQASGQRVVMAEAGIALTVPDGWEYVVLMLKTDWAEAAGVTEDVAVWRVLELWSPEGDPESASEHCSVGMLRAGERGPQVWVSSDATPAPGQLPPGWTHSSTEVLTPAGPATRIDTIDEEPDGDRYSSIYNLMSPDGPVWLGCQGSDPPDDLWYSIANTLELRPASEP